MKLDSIRASLKAMDQMRKRLAEAKADVSSDYLPLFERLEKCLNDFTAACVKAEIAVAVGDGNNDKWRAQFATMKVTTIDPSAKKLDRELKFLKSKDQEAVDDAKKSIEAIAKHFSAYQNKLQITVDVSGEEEIENLSKVAEVLLQSLSSIQAEIFQLPEPEKTYAETAGMLARGSLEEAAKATQAAGKMLGGFMPQVITDFAAKAANSNFAKEATKAVTAATNMIPENFKVKEDVREVMLDACKVLVVNCSVAQQHEETGKTRLEAFKDKELKRVGELMEKVANKDVQKSTPTLVVPSKRSGIRFSREEAKKMRLGDNPDLAKPTGLGKK